MNRSAAVLLICLFLGFQSAFVPHVAGTDYYISPYATGTFTGTAGDPFQHLRSICKESGFVPGSHHLHFLDNAPVSVPNNCTLEGSWLFTCDFSTKPCNLNLGVNTIHMAHADLSTVDISFDASGSVSAPAFLQSDSKIEINRDSASSISFVSARTISRLENASKFGATACSIQNPQANSISYPHLFESYGSHLSFQDLGFVLPVTGLEAGSVIYQDENAQLDLTLISVAAGTFKISSEIDPPRLITSKGFSNITISGVIFSYLTISSEVLVNDHPSLILSESGVVSVTGSTFSNINFDCQAPTLCILGSVFSIWNSSKYIVEDNDFQAIHSPGCIVHVSSSSGLLALNEFNLNVITGSPAPELASGAAYPPITLSTGQAAVCLTRSLENLESDFGVQLSNSKGGSGGRGFKHLVEENTWTEMYSADATLGSYNGKVNEFLLFGIDLWASNVEITFKRNVFSKFNYGSTRVDACEVEILESSGVAEFAGWIDFGSHVHLDSSVTILNVSSLSIYGAAPFSTSIYRSESANAFIRINGDAGVHSSLISAGIFSGIKVRPMNVGTFLLLGAAYPQSAALTASSTAFRGLPWVYDFQFVNGSVLTSDSGTFVDLVTLVAPLEILDTSSLSLNGAVRAPRLGSPYSVSASHVATIKGTSLRLGATVDLYVVDLCVIGDLEFVPGSKLAVEPSFSRSTTHGLNVTGSLKGSGDEKTLRPFNGEYIANYLHGFVSFDSEISIISAGNLVDFSVASGTEMEIPFQGMKLKTGTFSIEGSVHLLKMVLSKVELVFFPHANGAAVVATFPPTDDQTFHDWGVQADCSGLYQAPVDGMNCHWISRQDLLIWSNDTQLPSDMSALLLEPKWSYKLGTGTYGLGAVGLAPMLMNMWLPASIPQDVAFWLDMTPSYFLPWRGDEEPQLIWSLQTGTISGPMIDYLVNRSHDWRFEIPPNYLQPGEFVFQALVSLPSGGQMTHQIPLTISGPANCNPPAVFLDVPQVINYYESTPKKIRVLIDPACPANVSGPALFKADTPGYSSVLDPNPILTLPAYGNLDHTFGQQAQLTVTVRWEELGNLEMEAETQVTYRTISPTFDVGHAYELVAHSGDTHISLHDFPAQHPGTFAINWIDADKGFGFRCPVPVFEDTLEYPDPAYSPPTSHVRCFNIDSDPKTVYEPQYFDPSNPEERTLEDLNLWQPGLHSMAVTIDSDRLDNEYHYLKRLPISVSPQSTGHVQPGERAVIFPYPAGLATLSIRPSQQLTLQAVLYSGQYCTGCSYQWHAEGVPALGSPRTSFFTLPPNSLPFGGDTKIKLLITLPGGLTTETQSFIAAQTRPYGGTFTVTTSVSSNGTFDAEATRWVSEHAGLQYMITEQDCNPPYAHRLVAWPTHSSNWKSLRATIRGCEAHPVLFLHVMDGIGSTTSVSVEMAGYTRPAPFWTSEQIIDLASSISDNLVSGHWDTLLKQLQWMNSIPETVEQNWLDAKPTFVEILENSGLGALVGYVDFWPLVLNVAFGDPVLLRMVDSTLINDRLLTRPTVIPSRSELDGYLFAAQWQIWNAAFDVKFGPQTTTAARSANVQSWMQGAGLRSIWGEMLQDTFGGSVKATWAYDANRISMRTRVIDLLTAQTVEDWRLVRQGTLGVFLSPSASSAAQNPANVLWLQQVVFEQWTHPLMPTNPLLAPFDKVILLDMLPALPTSVTASFHFPIAAEVLNANPQLICAHTTALAWLTSECTTSKSTNPPYISCECSIPGDAPVSVTVLNPGAFCPQPIPANSNFICLNGAWVLQGNIDTPVIVVPPTSVTIIGNLTVDTIAFNGLAGTVNVTGCTKIGTSITIELTLEELEALISSGEITSLLLTSTGCDISDLKNIPISVTVNGGDRCEKVTVTSETTTTTLSGVFKVDTSGCKKKSSTWWIVLVSVLGGVIVLGAIFALLATFTPLKHIIRPHAKRAEEANTYYINEKIN